MRLLLILLFSASVWAQKEPVTRTMLVRTAIYCDHCAQCETCGGHFTRKLLRQKGVQMVTLDEAAMNIRVVYNSKKIGESQIRQAISKLGYDADDVKADPAAYAALDGCCKKE